MIKNYYFLIAGILAIVFSVTHALNGQHAVLPALETAAVPEETRTIFFYVWHIITAENLVFGIAFLVMSVQNNAGRVRFAAWMTAVLMIVRWVVIFGSTWYQDVSGLKALWTDSIAIAVYVTLILLGTRNKKQTFSK